MRPEHIRRLERLADGAAIPVHPTVTAQFQDDLKKLLEEREQNSNDVRDIMSGLAAFFRNEARIYVQPNRGFYIRFYRD